MKPSRPGDAYGSKPLPPPARDERLPALPPHDARQNDYAPPPPSKYAHGPDHAHPDRALAPLTTELAPGDPSGQFMATPTTPSSPLPEYSPVRNAKPKKANPLNDLIDTERAYVEQLTGIIRKVASAWSRSNLPPRELDSMFRGVEGVYKANRALLAKLSEIGANPTTTNPKALGDLLMRWIDDLEAPYANFCSRFSAGFDSWAPVTSNARLPTVLATFSASCPPPLPPQSPEHPATPPLWTLDQLFLLPKGRLKYYRKLYGRLLKSTTEGRSDHRLLVGAVEKLDSLLATLDQRSEVTVGMQEVSSPVPHVGEDEVVIDMRDPRASAAESTLSSNKGSSSGGERSSRDTGATSIDRASVSTMTMPISELEYRLSTDRTLDIFTMKPKQVRLQIAPPSLPFNRELLFSADVTIILTPLSTGEEIVHQRGHVYILTDLFLICERMVAEDRGKREDNADMWLMYPPLAGKHLRLFDVEGQDAALRVSVMKKENIILHAENAQIRDSVMAAFKECIAFATALGPSAKHPMPPMPGMNDSSRRSSYEQGRSSLGSNPSERSMSPPRQVIERTMSPPRRSTSRSQEGRPQMNGAPQGPNAPYPNGPPGPGSPPRHMIPGQPYGGPGQPPQPLGGPGPPSQPFGGPGGPGMGPNGRGQFAPGQVVIPPARSVSAPGAQGLPPGAGRPYGPGQGPPMPPGPDPRFGPPPGQGPPDPRNPMDPQLRKTASSGALSWHLEQAAMNAGRPPMPPMPGGSIHAPQPRMMLPSALNARVASQAGSGSASVYDDDDSPPGTPPPEQRSGPVVSTVSAQMKCKVFLQQQHQQWKALGAAKLKVYEQQPTNVKQLVVEAEDKKHSLLISTIVLTDGVERVGKTGVAIQLSDQGVHTGIIYMLQLRNEQSAGGLFDSLLMGSDRRLGK